jgi:hypothetical protein
MCRAKGPILEKASEHMRILLPFLALFVALPVSVNAQETAKSVHTSGTAELRRASEQMISPGSRNISISLPETVNSGEIISIQYSDAGNAVADSFMVTGITIKDGTCSIENKRNTAVGSALSDMIYARPCKKIR